MSEIKCDLHQSSMKILILKDKFKIFCLSNYMRVTLNPLNQLKHPTLSGMILFVFDLMSPHDFVIKFIPKHLVPFKESMFYI